MDAIIESRESSTKRRGPSPARMPARRRFTLLATINLLALATAALVGEVG